MTTIRIWHGCATRVDVARRRGEGVARSAAFYTSKVSAWIRRIAEGGRRVRPAPARHHRAARLGRSTRHASRQRTGVRSCVSGPSGWIGIDLDADGNDWDEVGELLDASFRLRPHPSAWSPNSTIAPDASFHDLPDHGHAADGLSMESSASHAYGLWRSLVSALVWGTRGREFESPQPDAVTRGFPTRRTLGHGP